MKENETLELKKSLAQLKEGIISLSAMLNKTGKAELYFGINDDGKVFEIAIGNKTLADITHEIQNNLKPLPNSLQITPIKFEDKQIIKVIAEGDDKPYSAYGKYYIRINDADIQMQANMLQNFFELKDDTYSKWEEKDTGLSYDLANEELVIQVMRDANEKGMVNYLYRNLKETLQKLGLLTENETLNNAGLYLFGTNKPLTIKLANYPTDTRTEFGEIREFSGNIFECINQAVSYIQNHINYKSTIVGIQREDVPEIPIRAIREIVINSFAHASYAKIGDCNQYTIYKSSIKIYNPGPILKNIDPLKFASGKIGSKIRNVLIASVLFKCGLIDSFGTGFDRTFTLCAQNGIEYHYNNDDFGFTFVFERDPNFLDDRINDRINSLDKQIISLLKEDKYLKAKDLANKTSKSVPTIQRHLDSLSSNNTIKRIGSKKTGYWEIVNERH